MLNFHLGKPHRGYLNTLKGRTERPLGDKLTMSSVALDQLIRCFDEVHRAKSIEATTAYGASVPSFGPSDTPRAT